MKKHAVLLILTTITIQLNVSSYGQKRNIDMEVTLTSPENEGVYEPGVSVPYSVILKNNGPDTLVYGDSIFLHHIDGSIQSIFLQQSLGTGQSASLINSQLVFDNTTSDPVTGTLCIYLYNDPSTQITNSGNPITVSYKDPDSVNNISCNNVTINTQPTDIKTSIQSIDVLNIYPNPTSSFVSISTEMAQPSNVNIMLKDLSGRTILQKSYGIIRISEYNPLQLNVEALPAGIYMLELITSEQKATGKIIVFRQHY